MPQNVPFSMSPQEPQLSSYTPTFNERAVDWLAKHWYGDNREGTRNAERLMDVANMTPLGLPGTAYDAGRAGGSGDYLGAVIMGAMSLAPGVKPKGFRAYHGSPHSFDKFDLSKIGTGEGAQSYGHGLYFADAEGTAQSYRDTLAFKGATIDGKPITEKSPDAHYWAKRGLENSDGGDLEKAISFLQTRSPQNSDDYKAIQEAQDLIKSGRAQPTIDGSMYEVQINADPEHFLDWDKPLSEQPEHIQQIARDMDLSGLPTRLRGKMQKWREGTANELEMPTGNDLHSALTDFGTNTKNNAELTEKLKAKGIPGIKYLDAGSRAGGDAAGMIANYGSREKALEVAQQRLKNASMGDLRYWQKTVDDLSKPESRNYVVFDDKLIDIIRKYGLAGLGIGMGGAASFGALGGPQQQQQAY